MNLLSLRVDIANSTVAAEEIPWICFAFAWRLLLGIATSELQIYSHLLIFGRASTGWLGLALSKG